MPLVRWPLVRGRPIVEITLSIAQHGQRVVRRLIADTGAGASRSGIDLLLDEYDCLLHGGTPMKTIVLRGAYVGSYPVYAIRVEIPALGFDERVSAAGLPSAPRGFDGIACFPFLNRFTYGNFGAATHFGLDV